MNVAHGRIPVSDVTLYSGSKKSGRRDQLTYETGIPAVPVHTAEIPKDRFALVLLKQDTVVGPEYWLELRERRDTVYPGRLALFGGMRKEGETSEACAVREIKEETGHDIGEADLIHLFQISSQNDFGQVTEGDVYLYKFEWRPFRKKLSKSRFRSAREKNMKEEPEDIIGQPFVIQRHFFSWFSYLNWTRFTPEAAYALIVDLDRDRRNRKSH